MKEQKLLHALQRISDILTERNCLVSDVQHMKDCVDIANKAIKENDK